LPPATAAVVADRVGQAGDEQLVAVAIQRHNPHVRVSVVLAGVEQAGAIGRPLRPAVHDIAGIGQSVGLATLGVDDVDGSPVEGVFQCRAIAKEACYLPLCALWHPIIGYGTQGSGTCGWGRIVRASAACVHIVGKVLLAPSATTMK
jgi:hypothetical protein